MAACGVVAEHDIAADSIQAPWSVRPNKHQEHDGVGRTFCSVIVDILAEESNILHDSPLPELNKTSGWHRTYFQRTVTEVLFFTTDIRHDLLDAPTCKPMKEKKIGGDSHLQVRPQDLPWRPRP